MVVIPNEIIYKIASYMHASDIYVIAKVFPNLRFTLPIRIDYNLYEHKGYKDKYRVYKIWYSDEKLVPIPGEIKLLQFHRSFNSPIDCPLPKSLESLYFGSYFNKPVDGLLPKSLKKLIFFKDFNHYVDNLPPSLEYLEFGERFNKPVDNLPSNLKFLRVKEDFSHPIDNLPDSIETLHIHGFYPHKIQKLPKNIKKFTTWTRHHKDYTGTREFDHLKNIYPNLNIKYFYKYRFVLEEIIT